MKKLLLLLSLFVGYTCIVTHTQKANSRFIDTCVKGVLLYASFCATQASGQITLNGFSNTTLCRQNGSLKNVTDSMSHMTQHLGVNVATSFSKRIYHSAEKTIKSPAIISLVGAIACIVFARDLYDRTAGTE